MNKKQLFLFWAIRIAIWSIWLFLIAVDGLSLGWSWLPWVGVGFLFAWQLDYWFRKDELGKAILLLPVYMILSDFVIGLH